MSNLLCSSWNNAKCRLCGFSLCNPHSNKIILIFLNIYQWGKFSSSKAEFLCLEASCPLLAEEHTWQTFKTSLMLPHTYMLWPILFIVFVAQGCAGKEVTQRTHAQLCYMRLVELLRFPVLLIWPEVLVLTTLSVLRLRAQCVLTLWLTLCTFLVAWCFISPQICIKCFVVTMSK